MNYATMTDKELKSYITEKIQTDNKWLRKAIIAIYNRQTEDEKIARNTIKHNGQGFSFKDVKFMTSIAQKIESGKVLSADQLRVSREIMVHYTGQLVRVVRENQPKAQAPVLTNKSGLNDGEEYNLGTKMGIYNATDDSFNCQGEIIQRYDTVLW